MPTVTSYSMEIGDINNLLNEGRTIQHHLQKNYREVLTDNKDRASRRFAKLMAQGKVRDALKSISDEIKGTSFPINKMISLNQRTTTVYDELVEKHPPSHPAHQDSLLPSTTPRTLFHPVIFERLTIRNAALHTKGSAGPSGINSFGWKRLCTSFKNISDDLCSSLALVARKLCTTYVDPRGIVPLTAGLLIALDKTPGVRPIAVGETVCRIIGKAILFIIRQDILEAAGMLQLCVGQEPGGEAVIHAMRQLFQDDTSEAVILVDDTNAFNSLNREAALHNIKYLCPSLATVLINTYRGATQLFIEDKTLFFVKEQRRVIPLQWSCTPLAPCLSFAGFNT